MTTRFSYRGHRWALTDVSGKILDRGTGTELGLPPLTFRDEIIRTEVTLSEDQERAALADPRGFAKKFLGVRT